MTRDDRQIRTSNGRGLVGYRAQSEGKRCIAIMKGNLEVLGIISLDDLIAQASEGPFLKLNKTE